MIAPTPEPPYYAVIFTSIRSDGDDAAYAAASDRMVALAAAQPGFLGMESARDTTGITVSYWASLAAIRGWKRHAEHIEAQRSGRGGWYAAFRVRIALVERDYALAIDQT